MLPFHTIVSALLLKQNATLQPFSRDFSMALVGISCVSFCHALSEFHLIDCNTSREVSLLYSLSLLHGTI